MAEQVRSQSAFAATVVDGRGPSTSNVYAPVAVISAGYLLLWMLLPNDEIGALYLIAYTLFALLLGVAVLEGRYWWLSPALWFGFASSLIFFLRPLADYLFRTPLYHLLFPIGLTYVEALRMGSLGIFAFAALYFLPRWVQAPSRPKVVDSYSSDRAIDIATLAFGTLVLCLTGAFVATSGGLSLFTGGRSVTTTDALETSSGYLYASSQWLFPIGLFYIVRELAGQRRWARIAVGSALILLSQAISIPLGDRSYFLPAFFCVLMIVAFTKQIRVRLSLVLIAVPIVVYFGLVLPASYRDASAAPVRQADLSESARRAEGIEPWAYLMSDDFSMVRNLSIALNAVPEQTGYALGKTYLGALVRPIPKQLLGGKKPSDSDTILNDAAIYRYRAIEAGFSYTFVSEPYYNFGWFGVFAVPALGGWLMRRARDGFIRKGSVSPARLCYFAALSVSPIYFVRGNIGTDYQRLLYWIVPLTGMLLLARFVENRITTQPTPGYGSG